MEGAHGPDVSALVCAALASGNGIPVNGDGVEVQFLLAVQKATEGDQTVAEGVKHPLLPDTA